MSPALSKAIAEAIDEEMKKALAEHAAAGLRQEDEEPGAYAMGRFVGLQDALEIVAKLSEAELR